MSIFPQKKDHETCLAFDDEHSTIRGFLRENGEDGFIPVSVKMLKVTTPTIPYADRLKGEGGLLAFIGQHENILTFFGVCVKSTASRGTYRYITSR